MQVKWNVMEKSEGELRVVLDSVEWGVYTQRAYRNLVKTLKVPGFRDGNVPDSIAKKRIRQDQINNEALNMAVPEVFNEGLKEVGEIVMVGTPAFNSFNPVDDGGFEFVYTIVVQPEAKLGEYKGISAKKLSAEVSEQEIDERIRKILEQGAELVIKEDDEPIELGDTAIIDYEATIDSKAFLEGTATDYTVLVGQGSMMEGFEQQLVGMKTNETKTFEIVLPERFGEELAGKTAEYKVTVTTVKQKVVPEISEEFVKELNEPGIETVADLRKEIENSIKSQKLISIENRYVDELMIKVVNNAEIDLPDLLVEQAIDEIVFELDRDLRAQGMEYEAYKAIVGKTDEQIRDGMRESAAFRVKSRLVVFAIAQAEKIDVTEEEIDQEIRTVADLNSMDFEELKQRVQNNIGGIVDAIAYRKVVELVKNNAVELNEEEVVVE